MMYSMKLNQVRNPKRLALAITDKKMMEWSIRLSKVIWDIRILTARVRQTKYRILI